MLPVDEVENLHQLAVEAENDASRRVLAARRRVLSLRAHFPDTNPVMRRWRRRLALPQMALEIARDEADSSQLVLTSALDDGRRDYEVELAAERQRRREEHEESYRRLDDEVDPGYLTDPETDIGHDIDQLLDNDDSDQDNSTDSGEEDREEQHEDDIQSDEDSDDAEDDDSDSDYVETAPASAPVSSPPHTRSRAGED